MVIFTAWIIWFGNKKGMAYWNWLAGYLPIAGIGIIIRAYNGPDVFLYSIAISSACVVYIAIFTLWPYLVSEDYAKGLEKQAEENKVIELKKSEQFYESMSEWCPVKTYVDSSRLYELHNDKNILDEHSIPSFVKTAGITTISVKNEHLERAAELLQVTPFDITDFPANDENS